jgi:hypothetical protein
MVSFPIMGFFVGSFSTLWFTSKVFDMIDIMFSVVDDVSREPR